MARAAGLIKVITINDAVYPCWYADVAYACDARWWIHHEGLPGFHGIKLGLEEVKGHPSIGILKNTGTQGFDKDPGALRSGGNGGYQALHLAAHFGISKAILVAYDLKGDRWFGAHPTKIATVPALFQQRVIEFDDLGRALAKRGIEVKRASFHSALTMFPYADLVREIGIGGKI